MAPKSPQKENGYTAIAHELLEVVIRHSFTKNQYKVVLCVMRRTYGFNKKADDMSYGQMAEATGLRRTTAIRTVAELAKAKVLQVEKSGKVVRGGELNRIAINKNYSEWADKDSTRLVSKPALWNLRLVSKNAATSLKNVPRLVSPVRPTKETSKETQKKAGPSKSATASPAKKGKQPIGIDRFLAECREAGEMPIPENDPIFDYAETANIATEHLRLCWMEFVERNRMRNKRYKDWRAAFRNCVRDRWYKLWFIDDSGQSALTADGRQAWNKHREAMRNAA